MGVGGITILFTNISVITSQIILTKSRKITVSSKLFNLPLDKLRGLFDKT